MKRACKPLSLSLSLSLSHSSFSLVLSHPSRISDIDDTGARESFEFRTWIRSSLSASPKAALLCDCSFLFLRPPQRVVSDEVQCYKAPRRPTCKFPFDTATKLNSNPPAADSRAFKSKKMEPADSLSRRDTVRKKKRNAVFYKFTRRDEFLEFSQKWNRVVDKNVAAGAPRKLDVVCLRVARSHSEMMDNQSLSRNEKLFPRITLIFKHEI